MLLRLYVLTQRSVENILSFAAFIAGNNSKSLTTVDSIANWVAGRVRSGGGGGVRSLRSLLVSLLIIKEMDINMIRKLLDFIQINLFTKTFD